MNHHFDTQANVCSNNLSSWFLSFYWLQWKNYQYIKRNVFSRRREPGMEMLLSPHPLYIFV